MGRTKKLYGYDMGQHIHNAINGIKEMERDFKHTLRTYPTNPAEWVKFVGRALLKTEYVLEELEAAKEIYDENKMNGS